MSQHLFERKAIALAVSLFTAGATHAAVLEEVIVEAQKKSETITETPISMQVVTGEQLQKMAAFTFTDLARSTPGLSMVGGAVPDLRMRGISSVTQAAVTLRTNVYQDGILLDQVRGAFDTLFDLSSVEVLKGAQGTLYSQSSPVGTINIRTKNPDLTKVEGYGQGSFGQRDLFSTQFGISVPIIENELGVRIAGYYDENASSGRENVTTGHDSLYRGSGARITTLWEHAGFTARLSYQYREKNEFSSPVLDGNGYKFDQLKLISDHDDTVHLRDQITTLDLAYDITDHLSIKSTGAYLHQGFQTVIDRDGLASVIEPAYAAVVGGQEGNVQSTLNAQLNPMWQNDLVLSSEDNDFWDWQIGAFYQRTDSNISVLSQNYQQQVVSPTSLARVYANTAIDITFRKQRDSYYTHNTLKLTDQLNLILGARYSRELGYSAQPGTAHAVAALYSPGTAPAGSYAGPFSQTRTLVGIPPDQQHLNDYAVSLTSKLQYFITPDMMTYISLDRAPRPGATNGNFTNNLAADMVQITPEMANSLELGVKGNFAEGSGRYSLSVFDQVYKDFQQDLTNINVFDSSNAYAASTLSAAVQNAKEAETRGVELSLTWQFLDNWNVDTNLAFTDSKYNDYKNAAVSTLGAGCSYSSSTAANPWTYAACDLSGKRLSASPRWSGNISSEYTMAAFGDSDWYVSGLLNFQGNQVDKLTRTTLPGFSTVDLFTGLRSPSGWDAKLWVKNVFDRRVITGVVQADMPTAWIPGTQTTDRSQPVFNMVNVNAPRQIGVTGSYHF